ncbi:hypothetical protein BDW59DRAFT_161053 [Aspergillus cavernicola]|uniref:Transferase family-domain-containing protein n=1 Tax=Aspergillus cavernicola TaxID=176166 RepID=A0ABR4IG41_9EURO
MWLVNYWRGRKKQSDPVPTDDVIQLANLDPTKDGSMELAFRFDQVLCPNELRGALERLFQIGNWRILGGRLRQGDGPTGSKFEIHVPAQHDASRPAFLYETLEVNVPIHDHPVGSQVPKGVDRVSILGNQPSVEPLRQATKTPSLIKHLVAANLPLLAFDHINFRDATIILMSFPHGLIDGVGYSLFLKAWEAVLHGREDEVPDCYSLADDRVAEFTKQRPTERYLLRAHALRSMSFFWFIVRIMWEKLWYEKVEQHTVCIAGWFVSQLRKDIMIDLVKNQTINAEKIEFVSESDVLLAWMTRTFVALAKPAGHRRLVLSNVVNIRPAILPSGKDTAYLKNAVSAAYTIKPVSQILREPVSSLAAQIRSSLIQQRTRAQIQAGLALCAEIDRNPVYPPLVGTADMFWVLWTNWDKADFLGLDFSPAVRFPATGGGPVSSITPSCVLKTDVNNILWPGGGIVAGRDSAGNWLVQWSLRKSTRAQLEKLLAGINEQERANQDGSDIEQL